MPVNINSAYRIRELLNAVNEAKNTDKISDVWANIFEINEKDQHKRNALIARILADLHDEVEIVRSEMQRLDYSLNLYSPSLDKCNNIFAVHTIMGQWNQIKQHISPEVTIALGFCSEIMPDEEKDIDLTDLQELKELAAELRSNLEESKLPPYIRSVIEKHLIKLEESLAAYTAVGVKAFEEAMQSAYGEVIANEVIFEEAKGSKELTMLSNLWKQTKSVIDGVTTVNKGIGSAQGLAEKGQQFIEYIQNL